MKNGFLILCSLIVVTIIVWNTGCKKKENAPLLTTTGITNITFKTATSGGTITDDGGTEVTEVGVCWSVERNPTLEDFTSTCDSIQDFFTGNITGLLDSTKYYVRAYANNSKGTGYGNEIPFTTATAPEFSFKYDVNNSTYESSLILVSNVFNEIHIQSQIADSTVTVKMPVEFTTGIHPFTAEGDYQAVYAYGNAKSFHSVSGTINILSYNTETLKINAVFDFIGEDIYTGDQIQISNGQFEVYY